MKFLLPLLTVLPSIAQTASISPVKLHVEKNGRVEFEAEHFHRQDKTEKRAWHITSKSSVPKVSPDMDGSHIAGASGGAYIECLPDRAQRSKDSFIEGESISNKPGSMGVLTYRVKFSNPGRYYCWTRGYVSGVGTDDSIHLGIDKTWPESGRNLFWINGPGWAWASYQDSLTLGSAYLDVKTAGVHEIQVSMREDGAEIDKFIFTTTLPTTKQPSLTESQAASTGRRQAATAQKKHISVPEIRIGKNTRGEDRSYLITAGDFPRGEAYILHQHQYLALDFRRATSADTSVIFPYSTRNYSVGLAYFQNRKYGEEHTVLLNGKAILEIDDNFLSNAPQNGKSLFASTKKIKIKKGDTITVKTKFTNPPQANYRGASWEYLKFSR